MKNYKLEDPPSKTILDNLKVGVIVVGLETGTIHYANERVGFDLSTKTEDIITKHYREIFLPSFCPLFTTIVSDCKHNINKTYQYYWTEQSLWEQITTAVVPWQGESSILLSITNITDLAQAEHNYKQIAYFDSTTRLPNERKLEEDVAEITNIEKFAVIYFEIEHLEDIFDVYGWEVTDKLLLTIRDELKEQKHPRTQVYRVEQGFALLNASIEKAEWKHRAKLIQERFVQPWIIETNEADILLYCHVKIGVVWGKYVKNEMRNLILRTIQTTENDKDDIYVFDEAADEALRQRRKMRDQLIKCIYGGMIGFSLQLQPIVDAETGTWVGAEALCRWTDPDGNPISPMIFIPEVEKLDLIARLDEWVRAQAMSFYAELGIAHTDFFLDVNYSPKQAIDASFIEGLLSSAAEIGFPIHQLVVEITESEKMSFDSKTLKGLSQLRNEGMRLGLDDFGSGYSSIENLFKLAATVFKTDKMLIENLVDDPDRQFLMQALIDMAHRMGMKVVTEGVETADQKELLVSMGADYLQGYYFSRPLSLADFKVAAERGPSLK